MTTTHELPADAFRRDRAGTDHLTIESRLARLETRISHHDEAEQEWRKRTRELDGRFEESMGRLNKWADHVEECLRMVDSNRDQNDNVHELILLRLGVDMSQAGDPPRMNAEQLADALDIEWPRKLRPDEPDPEPVTAGEGDADWAKWEEVNKAAHEGFSEVDHYADNWQDLFIDVKIAQGRANRFAVARAIELGLAVSPDDPRLQPLEVTDELIARVRLTDGLFSVTGDRERQEAVANAVIAHLNHERSVQ